MPFRQNYSLSVYLVKQLTSVTLLQKLRAKGIRNPDHSRALSAYPGARRSAPLLTLPVNSSDAVARSSKSNLSQPISVATRPQYVL